MTRASDRTPEGRIALARAVLQAHQAQKYRCADTGRRVLLDGTTAGAIVAVYDALNEANRAKFTAYPLRRMAAVAWKLVR